MSHRSGQPRDGLSSHLLFSEPQKLARAMGMPNIMGHHVTSTERQEAERLLRHVRELLTQMCEHGMGTLRLEDVRRFVQRPRRFLEG